jgi:hypothetical protein
MSKASSLLLFMSPALFALLSVAHERPEWLVRMGIDFGDLGVYERQLEAEETKRYALEQRLHCVGDRLAVKAAIIADLEAGRLTLFAAAARFRELDARSPSATSHFIELLPGASPGEKYCRSVLIWLDPYDHRDTETEARRLAQRLEKELDEHVRCHRVVELTN